MRNIVFIGGGNMAQAIIGGLVKAGRPGASLVVIEPSEGTRRQLVGRFGVKAQSAAGPALAAAEIVVWAVKPQAFEAAAAPCLGTVDSALQLSVMAGVRSAAIVGATGSERVVRAMPNTPALIGQGIAGVLGEGAEIDRGMPEIRRGVHRSHRHQAQPLIGIGQAFDLLGKYLAQHLVDPQ